MASVPSELDWAKLSLDAFKARADAQIGLIKAYGELAAKLGDAQLKHAEAAVKNAEAARLLFELQAMKDALHRTMINLKAAEREQKDKASKWAAAIRIQEGQALTDTFVRHEVLKSIVFWIVKIPVKSLPIGSAERDVKNFFHPSKPITPPDESLCSHDRLLVQLYLLPNNFVPKLGTPAHDMVFGLLDRIQGEISKKVQDAEDQATAARTRLHEIEDRFLGIKPAPPGDGSGDKPPK